MKITKNELRQLIREACAVLSNPPENTVSVHASEDVPSPDDYQAVADLLKDNSELVHAGIKEIMNMAGASCERSTIHAMIDYLEGLIGDSGESEDSPQNPFMMLR